MDRIKIQELKVFAHHGVFDFEKAQGQNFFVNATLFLPLQKAGRIDALEETVNYAAVCDDIVNEMQGKNYDLIEAAAEAVCVCLLNKYPRLQQVDLEIRKPEAPLDADFSSVSVYISRKRHRTYIAFGANLGDPLAQISAAKEAINADASCKILRSSEIIKTTPYGGVEQDDFYNGVWETETYLEPEELLDFLHRVEQTQGRVRDVVWGPRTLDLDILLFDRLVYESERLFIPHRDMKNRDFVLEPLASLTPDFCHPVTGQTIKEMLGEVKERHICK